MVLKEIALSEILELSGECEAQKILDTFESIRVTGSDAAHDVEEFIKTKAIAYDKAGLSATHLIFSTHKSKFILVGYYAIANKPLIISNRDFDKLSNRVRGRLVNYGANATESGRVLPSFLIGQIGKNYSADAKKTKSINGNDILMSAIETIKQVRMLISGKTIHLEYEDVPYLHDFYKRSGFVEIPKYTSNNNLKIAILRLD